MINIAGPVASTHTATPIVDQAKLEAYDRAVRTQVEMLRGALDHEREIARRTFELGMHQAERAVDAARAALFPAKEQPKVAYVSDGLADLNKAFKAFESMWASPPPPEAPSMPMAPGVPLGAANALVTPIVTGNGEPTVPKSYTAADFVAVTPAPQPPPQKIPFTGTVIDHTTGEPIAGATVTVRAFDPVAFNDAYKAIFDESTEALEAQPDDWRRLMDARAARVNEAHAANEVTTTTVTDTAGAFTADVWQGTRVYIAVQVDGAPTVNVAEHIAPFTLGASGTYRVALPAVPTTPTTSDDDIPF